MLLSNANFLCLGTLLFVLVAILYAGFAYRVNIQLPDDDPQKRNYHPVTILLAPVTLPFSVLFSILMFVLKVLLYGLALGLFTIVLVFASLLSAIPKFHRYQWFRKLALLYQR